MPQPMEIIPDKRKVVGLVEQAHEGKICLPNFQRDFVWTREEVADLVRSIVRGYFIGSLLLLRCDPNNPPFAPVFLRGSKPAYAMPRPELLVLDGQQRLSSLIYALTAPDLSLKDSSQRRWFFVNLDVLLDEPDSDEVVFDRAKRELRGLDNPETQYEQRMLPCTVLLTQQALLPVARRLRGLASRRRSGQARPVPLRVARRLDERGHRVPDVRGAAGRAAPRGRLRHRGDRPGLRDLREAEFDRRRPVGLRPAHRAAVPIRDPSARPVGGGRQGALRACARGRRARRTSTSSECSCCARWHSCAASIRSPGS